MFCRPVLHIAAAAAPLLIHPSPVLRECAVRVMGAFAEHRALDPVEAHVLLLPLLENYMCTSKLRGLYHLTTVWLLLCPSDASFTIVSISKW